jgi:hypothetical protein
MQQYSGSDRLPTEDDETSSSVMPRGSTATLGGADSPLPPVRRGFAPVTPLLIVPTSASLGSTAFASDNDDADSPPNHYVELLSDGPAPFTVAPASTLQDTLATFLQQEAEDNFLDTSAAVLIRNGANEVNRPPSPSIFKRTKSVPRRSRPSSSSEQTPRVALPNDIHQLDLPAAQDGQANSATSPQSRKKESLSFFSRAKSSESSSPAINTATTPQVPGLGLAPSIADAHETKSAGRTPTLPTPSLSLEPFKAMVESSAPASRVTTMANAAALLAGSMWRSKSSPQPKRKLAATTATATASVGQLDNHATGSVSFQRARTYDSRFSSKPAHGSEEALHNDGDAPVLAPVPLSAFRGRGSLSSTPVAAASIPGDIPFAGIDIIVTMPVFTPTSPRPTFALLGHGQTSLPKSPSSGVPQIAKSSDV